jgi:uncharacterized membrane protein YdjX (TVP38/TMEM64 family)
MPEKTGGWLEQHTMDVLRSRLVKRLRDADSRDRLRLYYPQLSSSSDASLMVHAKIAVIDDRLLRIGSSNLSNRSMGLDTECDLAIEAEPGGDAEHAIKSFREQLLAEHLAVRVDELVEVAQRKESLIKTIESLHGGERTLQELDAEVDPEVDQLVPESALLDPEQPIDSERLVTHFVPDPDKPYTARRIVLAVLVLFGLAGLAAAWRWTSLGDWLKLDVLLRQAGALKAHPATPLLVTAGIAVAAFLAVPLTLLVIAAILGFGSLSGFLYALSGAELSAILAYAVGRSVGRDLVRRFAGKRLNSISKRLSRRGLLTIITLRLVPVAPFNVINFVAGASHIRFRDFALGTLVGLVPGILAIALFADSVVRSIRDPDAGSFAWLTAVVVAIALPMLWLHKRLRGNHSRQENSPNRKPLP